MSVKPGDIVRGALVRGGQLRVEPLTKAERKRLKKLVKKGATVDGYGRVPLVPPQGNRTQPHAEGGNLAGQSYDGGPHGGGQLDGQAKLPRPRGADTEASAGRGPGSTAPGALVQQAWDNGRKQAGASRYAITTTGPMQRMMADQCARQLCTTYGWTASSQASPTATYSPHTVVGPPDLNSYQFGAFMEAVNAMSKAFSKACGRYPNYGVPMSQDDAAYQKAYNALLDKYFL
jgi:hypothetical protein